MKYLVPVILLLCNVNAGNAQAQHGSISVVFTMGQQKPIEGITAELIKAADSSLIKAAITDASGLAMFENIIPGKYFVRANTTGYRPYASAIIEITSSASNVTLPRVSLEVLTREMKEVTVTAKKPFVQRLTDRIVVNVENSIISAGSSAMDVLERSPGIRIGQNDAISLAGKQGVIIMINGKEVPMAGEELANYLRSLPSSVIERIDIITNPSSRYDAAGNAGIIDIRMKKDQKIGANGTVTGSYGQGRFPKVNSGATFNYRSKKINVFGNVNHSYAYHFNDMRTRREFYENNAYTGSYTQRNLIHREIKAPLARTGVDFFASKKTIIGFIATGSEFLTGRTGENESLVKNQVNEHVSSFLTTADGKENFKNWVINFNLKHTFDSTGKELSADFDIAGYNRDWGSNFSTGYYDANGQPSRPLYLVRTNQEGFTGIKTFKSDYTHPFNKSTKLETGIKLSFVNADNDIRLYDRSNGGEKLDSSQSNHFKYDENINAAYVNFSTQIKKFSFQVGLRAEHTHIVTYQVFDNVKLDSSYLKWFPTTFINYKFSENNSIGFSLSRRIDRPGYSQLNPFRIFVDPSFYASGDPSLKPAFTWSYELSYTRKQLNIAIAYSHTNSPVTYVLIPSPSQPRVTIQTPINLASFDYFGINFNAPLRITKWWNMINNGIVYYGHNKGYVAKTIVNSKTINGQFSTNHTLTFAKTWTGEVNFSFDSGNNTGVMKDQFYWILGAGIQKSILSKKGTIRLNVTDILYKQWPRFRSIYTNYHEYLSARRDTRIANLSFTYRFGKNTVAQARRRTTASEEERRRAQ